MYAAVIANFCFLLWKLDCRPKSIHKYPVWLNLLMLPREKFGDRFGFAVLISQCMSRNLWCLHCKCKTTLKLHISNAGICSLLVQCPALGNRCCKQWWKGMTRWWKGHRKGHLCLKAWVSIANDPGRLSQHSPQSYVWRWWKWCHINLLPLFSYYYYCYRSFTFCEK